ncbi:MAG: peptide chain release factor-like protein [bacterium]|nr:peptide chain release factor-like protein [bacterium]
MISPEKEQQLLSRMALLGVFLSDLQESFVRSSGAGGQKVNKTSSCVVLKHLPTGLEVKCQISRSQALNRFLARRLLLDKIEEKLLKKKSAEQQRREKIRRQKRKRSKRAKEKMLANKKHRSEKKKLRQRVVE